MKSDNLNISFTGESRNSIDQKNRLSIPAKYRKALSPVNNNEEEPLYSEEDWHKVASVNDRYAVDLGTVKTKKPDLTAYKPPNPPYDPKSGDDGAGGTEYDINK